jgi:hypothetical protein
MALRYCPFCKKLVQKMNSLNMIDDSLIGTCWTCKHTSWNETVANIKIAHREMAVYYWEAYCLKFGRDRCDRGFQNKYRVRIAYRCDSCDTNFDAIGPVEI